MALTELGILQREGGDIEASISTLQGVVEAEGLGTEVGAEASYHLIWSTWRQDRNAALRLADSVARDALGSETVRMHARWSAAMLAEEIGDFVRARTDYASILRDCADRQQYQGVVRDVRMRVEGLDGR